MAWVSAAALLQEYVYDDRQCDVCNSATINLISGSELTCLTCGHVTTVTADPPIEDLSLQLIKENNKPPILFDKGKLSNEWRRVCNQLKIMDDNFLRKMLTERRRSRRKIANNRTYFLLLIGSLYYIQKRNSGSSIFLSDIITRLGLSNVGKKFAKVVYEVSLQLNIKIHTQSIRSLISNLINQLTSNRFVEYSKIVNTDVVNSNSFLTQIISNTTLTLENEVGINSTTLTNFISENNKLISDIAIEILQHFQTLDRNLQIIDDVLASEWRQYGYSSKITLSIAIHIALYKLSISIPIKEYVTLLGINRSSFYRRRGYIQSLISIDDPIIPQLYFDNIGTIQQSQDVESKQHQNYLKKQLELKNEVDNPIDKHNISITNDNRSQSIVCRYYLHGKIKKRCFSFKRYGIQGARDLARLFKSQMTSVK